MARKLLIAAVVLLSFARNSWGGDSIQNKVKGITEQEQRAFGIKAFRWVDAVADKPGTPADESFPGFGFLVGCHGCKGAEYDPITGNLTNLASLTTNPTSWIYRIPENWNQKVVIQVPPGNMIQTFFMPYNAALLKEGYSVATMYHASPFGAPVNQFVEGANFHGLELTFAYLSTSHLLKDMGVELFGRPTRFLSLGSSTGVQRGSALIAGHPGSPFEGYVMVAGGSGLLDRLSDLIQSFKTDERMVLSCLFPMEFSQTDGQRALTLADRISMADPEYTDLIRNEIANGQEEAAYHLGLAYDLTERSHPIQQNWDKLEYANDIQAPTLIAFGGRDLQVPPSETALHAQRIIDAGKGDLLRVFIFKDMGHSAPTAPAAAPANLIVDAVHKVDAWVESGTPPEMLAGGSSTTAGVTAVIPSQSACGSEGLPKDPMECLRSILADGFVGFCSGDPSTSCISDNPTTAGRNEDNCVTAGKGTCDLVSPFPSECSEFNI